MGNFNTGQLISREKKLRATTSKTITNIVLSRHVADEDIKSGLYKPLIRLVSLIKLPVKVSDSEESKPVTPKD